MNEFFTRYKEEKSIEKIKQKTQDKINRHKQRQKIQLKKNIAKMEELAKKKKSNQILRFEFKAWKIAENKARKLMGINQTQKTKDPEGLKYRKNKAFCAFQKRARLSRIPAKNHYGINFDNQSAYAPTEWSDWGHIFSKSKYPHIAFLPENCRPISQMGNKMQGDQVASWWGNALTKNEFAILSDKANDKKMKRDFIKMSKGEKIDFYKNKLVEYTARLKGL